MLEFFPVKPGLDITQVRSQGRFYAIVDRVVHRLDGEEEITDLLVASKDPRSGAPIWDTLFPHKKAILQCGTRIVGAMSGVQGGKSINGPIWTYDRIIKAKRPGLTWIVTGPTLKQLKAQVMNYYDDFFKQTPLRGSWKHGTDHIYVLNDGRKGEIVFLYGDTDGDADKFAAVQGYGVHADELGNQTEACVIAIYGRVSGHGGPMFFTSTAYLRRPALKTMFWDKGRVLVWSREKRRYTEIKPGDDADITIFQFECEANPYYNREALDFAKRNFDDATYQVMFGGAVPQIAGVIYPEFSQEAHVAT